MNQKIIAVPSMDSSGLNSKGTTRFGRCPYFTIIHLKEKSIETVKIIENKGNKAIGGAGPMAAQLLADEGVNTVIGANYGPNASNALLRGGFKLYGPMEGTVSEILDAYLKNQLTEIHGATSKSHQGMKKQRQR